MDRRNHTFRQHLLMAVAASALVACGGNPSSGEENKASAAVELNESQQAIATALLEGYRKETGAQTLTEADIARAGCYAQNVDMPAQFQDVHLLYLADYTAIDADFYPWFDAQGVSEDDAWDIAERVKKGLATCSAS